MVATYVGGSSAVKNLTTYSDYSKYITNVTDIINYPRLYITNASTVINTEYIPWSVTITTDSTISWSVTGTDSPLTITTDSPWITVNGDGTYSICTKMPKFKRTLQIATRRRTSLEAEVSPAEWKARRLLRDLISERDWRRYVTNGFIIVTGKSGKKYQIFNNTSKRIQVYENNRHIESLCIHTDPACPPSDHVFNMKVLIEIDEALIYARSNQYRTQNWEMAG